VDNISEKTEMNVYQFMISQIEFLSRDIPAARREKAVWKRAGAKSMTFGGLGNGQICTDADAWSLLQAKMPEHLKGRGGTPSYAENAVYIALSAFANGGKNVYERSLGRAAKVLDGASRVKFDRLLRSKDMSEVKRNLPPVLSIINSKNGPGLDYAGLADDIYRCQFGADTCLDVRRKWERDYCSTRD
jgi:CRISPR type I-E-associated protein CasB/Cse2